MLAELDAVSLTFGPVAAVRGVTLAVRRGALVALLGPSGCGKTSLLKLLGGYTAPTSGRVILRGVDVTAVPPEKRGVGTVFQNYALFPHLSARRNVGFGLAVRGVPRRECDARAAVMLERVGLTPSEFDRLPAHLSGGQQQRVALARALGFGPDLLLLDEPFANLDRGLRDQLRGELRSLHRETGVTTVLVTHDADDALAAADLVGVLDAGRLVQLGPPAEVYRRPRTPLAARALGAGTLWPAAAFGLPGCVALVRPEAWRLGGGAFAWAGPVTRVTFAGADSFVEVAAPPGALTLRVRSGEAPAVGSVVTVGVTAADVWPIPAADDA